LSALADRAKVELRAVLLPANAGNGLFRAEEGGKFFRGQCRKPAIA